MRSLKHSRAEVLVFPDLPALGRAVADEFLRGGRGAIAQKDCFAVALAGGSTPRIAYATLAQDEQTRGTGLAWDKVDVFFGDERPVPPEHPDSNFRMAQDALLGKVPLKPERVHRIRGELEATQAAAEYEAVIRGALPTAPGTIPKLDLILLGMGADGHTASLFPGSRCLEEMKGLVCANWVEQFANFRITFTFPLLNAASEVLFMVAGGDKANMLRRVLRADPAGVVYPAQQIQPSAGRLLWMMDEAAAQQL